MMLYIAIFQIFKQYTFNKEFILYILKINVYI